MIWWSLRKKGIPEQYVAIIQDMYQDTQTRVNTRCDTTEYFRHRSWFTSRVCFEPATIHYSNGCIGIRGWHTLPWGLLFADDLALSAESSVEVEEELEKWRRVLEENGLKISRVKTKYLRPTNCQDKIYLLRERVPTVDSFSYLGLTIQSST